MRVMQAAEEPAEIKPLPEVRQAPATGSVNWQLAAGVFALLIIAGAVFWFINRGDGGSGQADPQASSTATQTEGLGGGARPGRPVGDVQKDIVPELTGVSVDAAVAALAEAEIDYIIVETDDASGTPGIVASQDPAAGAHANGSTSVTLVVPRG
jgi:hypothetical protein